jgi:hypothetical protein
MKTMQGNPYFAAIGGALHYLGKSGHWIYVLGVVLLVAVACALIPRGENKRSWADKKFSMWD